MSRLISGLTLAFTWRGAIAIRLLALAVGYTSVAALSSQTGQQQEKQF